MSNTCIINGDIICAKNCLNAVLQVPVAEASGLFGVVAQLTKDFSHQNHLARCTEVVAHCPHPPVVISFF